MVEWISILTFWESVQKANTQRIGKEERTLDKKKKSRKEGGTPTERGDLEMVLGSKWPE